jgi:uncharacterized OsmC-like protein
MKRTTATCIALLLLVSACGCVSVDYHDGEKAFSYTRFGTDVELKGFAVTKHADGVVEVTVESYNADQTEAQEAIIERVFGTAD